MRRVITLLLFLLLCSRLLAQQGEVMLGIKGGDNTLFGSFAAISVEAKYVTDNHFSLRGGGVYSTFSRVVAEVRPAYSLDFNFGQLSAELLLNFARQNNIDSYAVGGGLRLDRRSLWVSLGYYHRTMTRGTDSFTEPFNIYYEFGWHSLSHTEQWDLDISLTNSRLCELERHYQPSLALDGWWYPGDRLGVLLGVCYKPAGTFNMSSDYYQLYTNLGVCYKW